MSFRSRAFWAVLGAVGCAASGGERPAAPVAPEEPPSAISPPSGDVEPAPCPLEAATTVTKRDAVYEVHALLRNVTKATLEVDTPDRCPQGPAIFRGLGDEFDYYRSCARGACAGPRRPIHFTIHAGESIEVESIEIDPAHGSCNTPLSPGHYTLSFGLEASLRVCGGTVGTLDYPEPSH